jgi:hypothetical protein
MSDQDNHLAEEKLREEIKKIRAETHLARYRLRTEQRQNQFSWKEEFKRWIGVSVTFIGVVGGGWTVYHGISNYFTDRAREHARLTEEQAIKRKELSFRFNADMVKWASSLGSDSGSESSVMMLKYFGKDAIPILAYNLREEPDSNRAKVLIQAMEEVFYFNEDDKLDIFRFFCRDARYLFERECRKHPDYMNQQGMVNYLELFRHLAAQESFRARFSPYLCSDSLQLTAFVSKIDDPLTRTFMIGELDKLCEAP